jgi:hypothetical protein
MTASGPSRPRWWRASRDQAQAAARESQGRAAQALVGLDAALGGARGLVRSYVELDPGPDARRLEQTWTPIDGQADQAMTEYLDAVAAKDLDTDVEEWVAQYAVGLFAGIEERLTLATRSIEQWTADEDRAISRVRSLQSVLPAAVADARTALGAAAAAIEAARSEGFLAHEPQTKLAAAGADLDRLAAAVAGPSAGSAQDRLAAVHAIRDRAKDIGAEAGALAQEHDRLAARVLSLRTAAQVVLTQAADLPQILHELRRDFAASAFSAVERDAADVPAELAKIEPLLADASRLLAKDQQRYADAAAALSAARAALDRSRSATHAVADRLSALNAAKADPSVPWETTRRALRDAQRFVASQSPPDPRAVARLDGLAAQLDASRQLLERGPRPDFGAYLDALESVRSTAAEVVAQLRAAHARP